MGDRPKSDRMRLRRYLTHDHHDLLPSEIGRMEREARERDQIAPWGWTAEDMQERANEEARRNFASLSPIEKEGDLWLD